MNLDPKKTEKLKKVLELAARAGTEGEAFAAMERAREILKESGITIEEFQATLGKENAEKIIEKAIYEGKVDAWIWTMANAVGILTNTKPAYVEPTGINTQSYVFVGFDQDMAIAESMMNFLTNFGEKQCRKARKDLTMMTAHNPRSERSFRESFGKGYAGRILERAKQIREYENQQATKDFQLGMTDENSLALRWNSLVLKKQELIKEKMDEIIARPNMKEKGQRGFSTDDIAREAGLKAGDNVNLSRRRLLQ